MRLGIDFGTTRTVVAGLEDGNYPVCTFSWQGELKEYIPTLVAARDGALFFGWDAAQCLDQPDAQILRSMKRLMADLRPDDPVELGTDLSIPMLELVTFFLRYVKRMITLHGNLTVDKGDKVEVMVATPANANSNQRYITLEAFKMAGFSVLGAMNEPSAAAVEYSHRYLRSLGPKSPKKVVVVYDLGGGTFDTSVIGLADQTHGVIANEGIPRLGGDDFDEVILDMLLDGIGRPRGDLNQNETVRLLEECRERKEGLKPNTKKMVVDPSTVLPGEEPLVLETQSVYDRCEPLIERSLAAVESLIRTVSERGLDRDESRGLAALYLVGGSVSFPPVARALREAYPNKVKISPFPHAATAIGLAIAADPRALIRVRESVSRYFGVWREQGKDKVFDPIFFKDRDVDPQTGILRVIRRYRPVHNIGHLRYLECSHLSEGGTPEGDIAMWKEVYFPYDPELKDRKNLARTPVQVRPELSSQEVVEIYDYHAQGGLIQVCIESQTAGYEKIFSFRPDGVR